MKFYKKCGFSLAEALIFLLVACLILLASMPVITRRHIIPPERVPHGKWACKLINGVKHQATAAHSNAELPSDDKWVEGCVFPKLPAKVKYIIVRVIGAGANGGAGNVSVDPTNDEKILYRIIEKLKNENAKAAEGN